MSELGENSKDVRIAELETRVRELVAEVESCHASIKQLAHTLRGIKSEKRILQQQIERSAR